MTNSEIWWLAHQHLKKMIEDIDDRDLSQQEQNYYISVIINELADLLYRSLEGMIEGEDAKDDK